MNIIKKQLHIYLIISFSLIISACSLIPNTDNVKTNMRKELIPAYINYVESDKNLTKAEKTEFITDSLSEDYNELCTSVVPRYIDYVKADKKLTKEEKHAYLNEAKSYILVNQRFK